MAAQLRRRPRRTPLSWLLRCGLLLSSLLPSSRSLSIDGRRPRVAVIGAGVGGLASAARIASLLPSAEVTVLEKNDRDMVGGRCGSFDVDVEGAGRFRHERGPSLLLLRGEYERLFEECGVRGGNGGGTATEAESETTAAQSYGLEMRQCIPAYQGVFEDGTSIPLGFPRSKCSQRLSREEIKRIQILEQESIAKLNGLEPHGFRKWTEYLETCSAYLECGLPNFIEERLDLSSFPAFLREALREGGRRWPLQPHGTMLSSLFDSPEMVALASFQDLYVGLEPYANPNQLVGGVLRKTAPAVFGLLAALELHPTSERAGVFAPVGGFQRVAGAMRDLCADLDVRFRFGTSVTSVTDEGVHFVCREAGAAERGFLPADLVVCNADVPFATATIVRLETALDEKIEDEEGPYRETYDWDDSLDYSSGVLAFHWSVSRRLDALETHNVFLSAGTAEDAVQSWAVLRDGAGDDATTSAKGQPFNFYVHRASRTDDTACPPECDAIMALVPCPALARDRGIATLPRDKAVEAYKEQFGEGAVDDVRDAVLERMAALKGLEGLRDAIVDEVLETPGTYAEYYNVGAGVPFGLSHGLGQLSLTRPAAECKGRDNVLFVGASSRPGNGVPLVLIGSRQLAKKVVEKLKSIATFESTAG